MARRARGTQRGTNQMQQARVYSHNGPMRCRKRGDHRLGSARAPTIRRFAGTRGSSVKRRRRRWASTPTTGRDSRGGFTGTRGGFTGTRGGFTGTWGGFTGTWGGFAGTWGGFAGTRGGFASTRGGFTASRGGFTASRGGFSGSRGGFAGTRGGFTRAPRRQAQPGSALSADGAESALSTGKESALGVGAASALPFRSRVCAAPPKSNDRATQPTTSRGEALAGRLSVTESGGRGASPYLLGVVELAGVLPAGGSLAEEEP
eukprot:1194427-Prorocentrum_minimum.AAC.4